ncbi:hypothetical protein HY772_06080 [Candidatus Woesearchaeota archaeon]|nr:hypothetical protein [Candidatus Woesearchaeota archaeon]
MALYLLEDDFEIVTDHEGRMIATRYPEQPYERFDDEEFPFYIHGSVNDPEMVRKSSALHYTEFPQPPHIGEYLVQLVGGVHTLARLSKIASINANFSLEARIKSRSDHVPANDDRL